MIDLGKCIIIPRMFIIFNISFLKLVIDFGIAGFIFGVKHILKEDGFWLLKINL